MALNRVDIFCNRVGWGLVPPFIEQQMDAVIIEIVDTCQEFLAKGAVNRLDHRRLSLLQGGYGDGDGGSSLCAICYTDYHKPLKNH